MSFNEKLSYTEHVVTSPTTDFPFGFKFIEGVDAVRVLVNDVDALEAGYAIRLKNEVTMEVQPPVESGVVRIYRETNIDNSLYRFTAGAKFVAANMDANFNQILHSQQEIRDQFIKLRADTFITLENFQEENFKELKEYVDGVFGMTNPNLFDGITDNMVIDEFGDSQRHNNRDVRKRLATLEGSLEGVAQKEYVDALVTPLAVEADVKSRLDLKADLTYVDTALAGVANGLGGTFATYADALAGMAGKPANTSANVTKDPDPTKNGLYRWDGTTLIKSDYDPLSVAAADATAKANNALAASKAYTRTHTEDSKELVKYMSSVAGLKPLAPVVGTLFNVTNYLNVARGRYVLNTTNVTTKTIRKITVYAPVADVQFEVRVYSKSGTTLHMEKSVAKLTTKVVGLNTFTIDDFEPFTVPQGMYIGFECVTTGSVAYGVATEATDYYWSSGTIGSGDFEATNAGQLRLVIAFYDEQDVRGAKALVDAFKKSTDRSDSTWDNILEYTPAISGLQIAIQDGVNGAGAGHYVIGQPMSGFGIINKVNIWTGVAGNYDVGVYSKSDRTFTRKAKRNVALVVGSNSVAVDLPFSKGDYIGIRTIAASGVKYINSTSNHQNMFVCSPTSDPDVGTASSDLPLSAYQYQLQFEVSLTHLVSDTVGTKWAGLKYVSFGDSITWYNGRAFVASHVEVGKIAKGYQSYVVDALGCTLDNRGESGWTMPSIYAQRISQYDFKDVYITTITAGANDNKNGIAVGTVQPIGANFNVNTYSGALQASIEHVIKSNVDTKIVLITPIRGWYNEYNTPNVPNKDPNTVGVLNRAYPNAVKEIAALYGLQVIDFYDDCGLNDLNCNHFLGDNPDIFTSYLLHPTNQFFGRMGEVAVSVLKDL